MPEQPMISVRGEAFREVPPELAVISVTVSARGRNRQDTLDRLTELEAQLRTALDAYPDAIERRETAGVKVFPGIKRGGTVSGYTGQVTTTVTVTDFAVLGELLLRLGNQEQTAVAGPWWQLRPGGTAGSEVRREAITDALNRAREYAGVVGARVARLVEIVDESAEGAHPMMRAAAFSGAPESDVALVIDPQQQTVRAAVTVRVTITKPTLD
jgi:uncharacterized protein YggE